MRPILLAALVLLAMTAPAALPAQDLDAILARFNAARKTAPEEIAAYMDRAEGCWHFAGEEPYNAARRAEINRALTELKCTTLKADGQALRRKYARSAPALAALDAAAALE
ncbi:hypothetical protein [Reyranella sp.]|uniref:hypothetical protein n=1 Tax=Reyranella sp. TaxID=1929291 RepID=UPI00121F70C4|nr:hypothetical protein [Reyranella sp.]TAJ84279.1 MAG: hypothetical protein EPO50_19615 [Reyranella sp.]